MENVIMKFKDAPIGARFRFIGDDVPESVYIKIHDYDDGLVVKWNGNVKGWQSQCIWLDKENGYDFDTKIEVIELFERSEKEPTNDFLIGLGFRKTENYYEMVVNHWEIILDLVDKECSITDFVDEISLPFPNTEQAVLNLIDLLKTK